MHRSSRLLGPAIALLLLACGDNSSSDQTGTGGSSSMGVGAGTGSGGAPGNCPVFPPDNPWNTDISTAPLDPLSAVYLASIGLNAAFHPDFGDTFGIPFLNVDSSVTKAKVVFEAYPDESDQQPYPIPPSAPIEDGGDAHVVVVQTDECRLYELYHAHHEIDGWHADSGAIWDLDKNDTRPEGWTSADAAGLPIYPGLARFHEAEAGAIKHALRFTAPKTQAARVPPALHFASNSKDPSLPPMGLRVRLKQSYDIQSHPKTSQVILIALKTYGMILADNGSPWYVSGAPNPGWVNEELDSLKDLRGSDFEVIATGPLITKK